VITEHDHKLIEQSVKIPDGSDKHPEDAMPSSSHADGATVVEDAAWRFFAKIWNRQR
jgi:hypothetical protein